MPTGSFLRPAPVTAIQSDHIDRNNYVDTHLSLTLVPITDPCKFPGSSKNKLPFPWSIRMHWDVCPPAAPIPKRIFVDCQKFQIAESATLLITISFFQLCNGLITEMHVNTNFSPFHWGVSRLFPNKILMRTLWIPPLINILDILVYMHNHLPPLWSMNRNSSVTLVDSHSWETTITTLIHILF